jgi:hypothetical protein
VKVNLHVFLVKKIDLKEFYDQISFSEFIHKTYINVARELFNNPFLFRLQDISPQIIKSNQRECILLIKDSIKATIRNLIPLELLLTEFLNFNEKEEVNSVKVLAQSDNKLILSNPKRLELEHKYDKQDKQDSKKDIPLLNTVGENVMEKVFSSFNIKETLPNLVDMNDVESVVSNSIKLKSHHTLSNFLKEPPKNIMTETIKQSAIEEYDAVYNND